MAIPIPDNPRGDPNRRERENRRFADLPPLPDPRARPNPRNREVRVYREYNFDWLQNLFMDEAHLPQRPIALWINRIIRWSFFIVLEGIIISLCFGVLGHAFSGAPEFMTPLLSLFQIAMFLYLSYHAIFRINIFR